MNDNIPPRRHFAFFLQDRLALWGGVGEFNSAPQTTRSCCCAHRQSHGLPLVAKDLLWALCSAGDLDVRTCTPAVEHCTPLFCHRCLLLAPSPLTFFAPTLAFLSLLQPYLASGCRRRTAVSDCSGSWALGLLRGARNSPGRGGWDLEKGIPQRVVKGSVPGRGLGTR